MYQRVVTLPLLIADSRQSISWSRCFSVIAALSIRKIAAESMTRGTRLKALVIGVAGNAAI